MRLVCSRCARTFATPPADGICPFCETALVAEPDVDESERHGDPDNRKAGKRRL